MTPKKKTPTKKAPAKTSEDEIRDLITTQTGKLSLDEGRKLKYARAAAEIKLIVRGGQKYTTEQAIALAQFSVINQLNPTVGECFYAERIGPVVGIEGLRRKASERYQNETGGQHTYFIETVLNISPTEFSWKNGDYVSKAILHDPRATGIWIDQIKEVEELLRNSGSESPFDEAKSLVGPKPVWIGYGRLTEAEIALKKLDKSEGLYGFQARADKRAEAAALRKRFQIGIVSSDNGEDVFSQVDVIETDFVEVDAPLEDIFEPGSSENYLVDIVIENTPITDPEEAVNLLDASNIDPTNETQVHDWTKLYQGYVDGGSSEQEAVLSANRKHNLQALGGE